ncbi:MAG: DHH family phosphoesterase [Planctomycetia bacterium]|nr:DHH family phosphoesterase [Planctomycetia bacterium]
MTIWEKIYQEIEKADSIMLTTHENPDGDGIGSIVAFYEHLRAKGKECRILLTSRLPEEYHFLDSDNNFEVFEEAKHTEWLRNVDLSILLDIGNYTRTGKMWNVIQENGTTVVNIDHHPYLNGHPFTINVSDVNASATGELIYSYLKAVDPDRLSKNVYEAIYIAIMTDTGSFSYNNTNVICHEIAANAIKAGVETAKIHQKIYGSSSRSRIRLLAAVANNLHYTYNGKLVWFKITKEMMKETDAIKDDVDGFTDFARAIKGVEVALMIFENAENSCRINFRSKGHYSINKIAQHFEGGGHSFAAGAKVNGKISEVASKVVDKTIEIMKEQEKVTD